MSKFISSIVFIIMLTTAQFGYSMLRREQRKSAPANGSEKQLANESNEDLANKVKNLENRVKRLDQHLMVMSDLLVKHSDQIKEVRSYVFVDNNEENEELNIRDDEDLPLTHHSSISEKLDFFANIVFCSVPVVFVLSIIYNKYFAKKKKHKKSEDFDFDE